MTSIGQFRYCGTRHCITWVKHCVPEGFKRVRIQPDGSCLFRSIVRGCFEALSSHEDEQVRALRRRVAASLRNRLRRSSEEEKYELFQQARVNSATDFEAYVVDIEGNAWGGELELLVLSQWYWIVLHQGSPPILVYHARGVGGAPIHILYNGHSHYDLLLSVS